MPKHQIVKKSRIKKNPVNMSVTEMRQLEQEFATELDTNPQFSLEVDPGRIYDLDEIDVEFIQHMVQYKNIRFVGGVLMHLEEDEALRIYKKYAVQQEIKRINLAMYARRFCSKMADLDALGGYLTTALTDENVPIADRLSGKDKLTAVRLLMELNALKMEAWEHPEAIDVVAIEAEVKKLNVRDIEKLIENSEEDDKVTQKKNELISKIDKDGLLTPEEVTYLRTLTNDELEKLLKETEVSINDKTDKK